AEGAADGDGARRRRAIGRAVGKVVVVPVVAYAGVRRAPGNRVGLKSRASAIVAGRYRDQRVCCNEQVA
ncbi:MAG TPA: hypothetical protein VJQ54_10035, partial [Candidatus Sulfotelmatobacter sp.]|nr:hypothetical protein [Candidatus Sulfotelmatobacter sp.]